MSTELNENSDVESLKAMNEKAQSDAVVLLIQDEASNANNNTNNDPSTTTTPLGSGSPNIPSPATTTTGTNLMVPQRDNLKSEVQLSKIPSHSTSPVVSANVSPSLDIPAPNETPTPQPPPAIRSEFSNPKSRYSEPPIPADINSTDEVKSTSVQDPGPGEDHEDTIEDEEDQKLMENNSNKKLKFWVLVEWVALVCITGALVSTLTIEKLEHLKISELELWKWCVLLLVIACGRMLTDWFMNSLVFVIEKNFLLRTKILYFVYGLKKSVQVFIWWGLVLLAWALLFDGKIKISKNTGNNNKILDYVTRALIALVVGAAIWFVKTLLIKMLAASFHVNTYFFRVKESLYHQYVLKKLTGPPAKKTSRKWSIRSVKKAKNGGGRDQIYVDRPHGLKKDTVSAETMKNLCNVISTTNLSTVSKTISEEANDEKCEQKQEAEPKADASVRIKNVVKLLGNVISKVNLSTISKEIDQEAKNKKGEQQNEVEITCKPEAKAAAERIFQNVAGIPESGYISKDDLLRFFSKTEVDNVLLLFEGAVEAGKINTSMLNNWVVKVYLERKSLGLSLNDTQTAVEQLNKIASVLVLVVIFVVSLLILGIATTQLLLFVSSQMLLIVFVFGNTAKTIFEGIIFVFVMHPFDVGDRCVIDGVQMIVEEMNILSTNFLRYDNQRIFFPNALLATKCVGNMFRSPFMGDSVEFAVNVSTTVESIGALKEEIKKYIESKPEHWNPNHSVMVLDIENMNRMKMALYVTHTMNYQDMGEKTSRRSDLVIELKRIFKELSIKYDLLPQEVLVSYAGSATTAPVTIG